MDRGARLDARSVLELGPNRPTAPTGTMQGLLDRDPLRGVVDVTQHVQVRVADRPWIVVGGIGPLRRQDGPGRDRTAGRGLTPDGEELVPEPRRATAGPVDVHPDRDRLDLGPRVAPHLRAPFRPPAAVAAAPRGQLQPLLEDRRGANLEHGAPHHPVHRVAQTGIGRVVTGHVLEMTHHRIEPAPPRRVDLGQPDPATPLEHPPLGGAGKQRRGAGFGHGGKLAGCLVGDVHAKVQGEIPDNSVDEPDEVRDRGRAGMPGRIRSRSCSTSRTPSDTAATLSPARV